MRCWPLVALSLLSACSFRVPRGIPVRVSGKATVRADVRLQAQGATRVDTALVPLQGAPVTEFFGVPLADAREVLFVLDVSGSMSERAEGRLAMIPAPPPPSDPVPPSPVDPAPNTPPPDAPPPNASNAPPAGTPAPMGYPPGYPPPSSVPQPQQQPPQPSAGQPAGVAVTVPTKLQVAQAELIEALSQLPAGTRLNILVFSDDVAAYAATNVVLDETRRMDLVGFVREMQAVGATALQPALRLAFLLDAPRIVLLSDGLGNVGLGTDDILRDTREAARGGVRIDAIGIGPGHDVKLLTTLAAETGGLYQPL